MAQYAVDNDLTNIEGWRGLRKLARKNEMRKRMINQAKLRSYRHTTKYMYGYRIPRACADMLGVDEVIGRTVGCRKSREIVLSRVDVVNEIMFVPGLDFLREVGRDKRVLRSSVGTCGLLSGAVHFGVLVKLVGEKDEARVDVVVSGCRSWRGSNVGHSGNIWKAWSLLFERLGVKD